MLEFSDEPYKYFPPRRAWLIGPLLRWLNRNVQLPRKLLVQSVVVSGLDQLRDVRSRDTAMLMLANHSTHADAPVFLEAARQARIRPRVMAAYDVFLRGRFDGWIMQKLGAFSVDREGSDNQAMKTAMQTVKNGRYALTIFPEGNVYLENDRVTPFHDGAAFIALKVARDMADQGKRVAIAPVSIKLTHATDVQPQLTTWMQELAKAVEIKLPDDVSPKLWPRLIGIAALKRNIRQRGADVPETEDPVELIAQAADPLLTDLETKLQIRTRAGDSLIERVRKVRRVIHEVRTDMDRAADHAAASTWADQAMLAFRIASYSGDYAASHPSLDRMHETIEKLAEDIYSRMMPPLAPRHAFVRFNRPIRLEPYLAEKKFRDGVSKLTADCEAAVQLGLDELNQANTYPGAKLWE